LQQENNRLRQGAQRPQDQSAYHGQPQQQPTLEDHWRQAQAQVTPQQQKSVLEELEAVRAKSPDVEKALAETHLDYFQTRRNSPRI